MEVGCSINKTIASRPTLKEDLENGEQICGDLNNQADNDDYAQTSSVLGEACVHCGSPLACTVVDRTTTMTMSRTEKSFGERENLRKRMTRVRDHIAAETARGWETKSHCIALFFLSGER